VKINQVKKYYPDIFLLTECGQTLRIGRVSGKTRGGTRRHPL
jgi:hypothetical protein